MVRVNLINPEKLADQHLIAEYAEILILRQYILNYPSTENLPEHFTLNKGHMRFFKDKVRYLKERHDRIRKEMIKRKFQPKIIFNLKGFKKMNLQNWKPCLKDKNIIKKRIKTKLRKKPKFYRYYGQNKKLNFFINLIS